MGGQSRIAWTDSTWSPVTGCTKVSVGCQHCYADRYAKRQIGDWAPRKAVYVPGSEDDVYERPFSHVMTHPDRLEQPLHWKRPRRIFVCSMGDLFHESVPAEFIVNVFEAMAACPQHTFQVLTKRPERLKSVLFGEEGRFLFGGNDHLPNVWIGTSVEDQKTADQRIPILLASGWIGVKWMSVEPMLGPVDATRYLVGCEEAGTPFEGAPHVGGCIGYTPPLDWVVCGGESGPHARPMDLAWARSLRDQCQAVCVPFFMKQDSGRSSGMQGRIPDDLWNVKEFPQGW